MILSFLFAQPQIFLIKILTAKSKNLSTAFIEESDPKVQVPKIPKPLHKSQAFHKLRHSSPSLLVFSSMLLAADASSKTAEMVIKSDCLQYFSIKNYLMSLEQQELYEQNEDLPFQSLKINNQNTTVSFRYKNTSQAQLLDFESCVQSSTDCSFQQGIHHENMEILRNAAVRYLEEGLTAGFEKEEGFKDAALYENLPFQVGGQSQLEMLTVRNELLSQSQQEELLNVLKKEDELVGLLREVAPVFGITVGKEVVYAIVQLLRIKMEGFKALTEVKATILPKFSCFQGFEDEEFTHHSSSQFYQDFNLQEISQYAEKDLQQLSSTLYFSYQIKYLNLREVKPDTKGNVLKKFNFFMKQLSKTVFFTIAGAIEPPTFSANSLFTLDLSREISFTDFSEGTILSIHRSMSRPFVPCQDEQLDFLSKKLKFQ